MNKLWFDTGTPEQISLRPDIYPVLIRSFTDADGAVHTEKMGFTERDWDTHRVTDNWWTCSFVPQDRYNSEGFEYTYYVGEEFTTANLNDYVCSGGYTGEPAAFRRKFCRRSRQNVFRHDNGKRHTENVCGGQARQRIGQIRHPCQ
jgi:hypothetical protein